MPPRSRHAQRRPYVPPHLREGYRPDRAAKLAVILAVVLILIAAASAHGAVLRTAARAHAAHSGAVASVIHRQR